MLVFNGKMQVATLRKPGGVYGNGKDTIDRLLEKLNSDPRRGTDDRSMLIKLDMDDEALYVVPGGAGNQRHLILEGVLRQEYPVGHVRAGEVIRPFTLEYERGFQLYRATINLAIIPDDNMSVTIDGDGGGLIRLVATAMPRMAAYE